MGERIPVHITDRMFITICLWWKMEYTMQRIGEWAEATKASTLAERDYKSARNLVMGGGQMDESDQSYTLHTTEVHGVASMEENNYRVRRLTPLECERLQGYPDGWTDIGEWTDSKGKVRQTTDSARYKALGNSIGLPPWKWVLKRISAQYERDATMASLFDGISGFPLIWTELNGEGSVLWSSEIEDFCIAVAKRHFGDEETGERGDWYAYVYGIYGSVANGNDSVNLLDDSSDM